ncbi:MAG: hypothetical protein Q7V62_17615, partial [Actinomycetota bacterium]|nr:hypothetical protein [Actinomycetota bacterium]
MSNETVYSGLFTAERASRMVTTADGAQQQDFGGCHFVQPVGQIPEGGYARGGKITFDAETCITT